MADWTIERATSDDWPAVAATCPASATPRAAGLGTSMDILPSGLRGARLLLSAARLVNLPASSRRISGGFPPARHTEAPEFQGLFLWSGVTRCERATFCLGSGLSIHTATPNDYQQAPGNTSSGGNSNHNQHNEHA